MKVEEELKGRKNYELIPMRTGSVDVGGKGKGPPKTGIYPGA